MYFVYGRRVYEEPLEYIATVPQNELQKSAGDRGAWVELIAFPKTAVIRVIPRVERDE